MAIAAAHRVGFFPVPKEVTRHADTRRAKLDEDAETKKVYAQVDQRDGRIKCRCCGRHPSKGGSHTHNHLRPRSLAAKAVKHSLENIHGCCLQCNLLLKNQKIHVIGRDCNKKLAFVWTALATKKEREGLTLRDERNAA